MIFIAWIFVGLIAGAVARAVYAGKDPDGFLHLITTFIGIGGSILGGFVSLLFGLGTIEGLDAQNLLMAMLVSVLLLFLYQKFTTTHAGNH